MKNRFIIILPTHSNYLGIVRNFLELLNKNWNNCPYDIVVSITGEKAKIDGVKNLYNGSKASLVDCVVNAAKKYKSDYYACFLGDAFMNKKIDNNMIVEIFDEIAKCKADYCSLQLVKNYKKEKRFSEHLRHINNLDRYSHNFTAFVASHNYIVSEMTKFATDLDFEKSYLYQKEDFYFDNHMAVRENYFGLLPSITKGQWDRINYNKLRKDNPEIIFEKREMQSRRGSIINHIRSMIVSYLPSCVRVRIKSVTERLFKIKFGVEG